MNPVLRPMSLGEILDRTFRIYRDRFWIFFGLSAFPAAVLAGLQFLNFFWWKLQPPHLIPILGINFGFQLFFLGQYQCSLFLHALAWPCIMFAASRAYLGYRPGLWSSIATCGQRWKGWVGLALLVQLIVVILAELAAAGVFLGVTALVAWVANNDEPTMDSFLPVFMGAMVLGGFALSLWLGTLYLEAIPAWGAEALGVRRSFKRARLLSKGSRWPALFARVVPVVMLVVLEIAAAAIIRWVLIVLMRTLHHSFFSFSRLYGSANTIVAAGTSALVGPIFPIALTLLYYDQRIRKEGFDIEWMMQSAGMEPAPSAEAAETEAPVPAEGQPA